MVPGGSSETMVYFSWSKSASVGAKSVCQAPRLPGRQSTLCLPWPAWKARVCVCAASNSNHEGRRITQFGKINAPLTSFGEVDHNSVDFDFRLHDFAQIRLASIKPLLGRLCIIARRRFIPCRGGCRRILHDRCSWARKCCREILRLKLYNSLVSEQR